MLIPNAPAVSEMSEGVSTFPEATYNLRCAKAEYVAVPKGKDAKGPYIKADFVVTGPSSQEKYLGRHVFENLSLSGEGTFRLRELLKVTGHADDFKLGDSDELVNLECGAAVAIEKGTGGYADKNRIKKFMPLIMA